MTDCRALYLDLVKRVVANTIYEDTGYRSAADPPAGFEHRIREEGLDWPTVAHTMIGLRRLENVQSCVEDVIERGVPGDLIETGVWRGGTSIFMRAILKAHGVTDRKVWVADSFEGLPEPDPERYPQDAGDRHHTVKHLKASIEEVKANFSRYDLLDEQVAFLKGWFRDTLPIAPVERLAVMRLDGDMYESTMDAFLNLYPKLSEGGYVIVDDYGATPACRAAVEDFRGRSGIDDEMKLVDWTGVYWRRSR